MQAQCSWRCLHIYIVLDLTVVKVFSYQYKSYMYYNVYIKDLHLTNTTV